jgi:methylglutaconyl-CoA hydratase
MTPFLLATPLDAQTQVLTLNRPTKRNALCIELIESLRDAVLAAEKEPGRRALILRGEGPVFCAGLDLREAADPALSDRSAHALAELYQAICASPLVTIAAAQGGAIGGGAGLVAACDLVVASEDLRIGFPEVRRGLVAALVTCLFQRQLGGRALREAILLGQNIDAPRALELGLVNRVTPESQLMPTAAALAREACAGAPGAIARTKRLLDDLAARPLAQDLKLALEYHLAARNSAEAAEGVAAFNQKREPRWG